MGVYCCSTVLSYVTVGMHACRCPPAYQAMYIFGTAVLGVLIDASPRRQAHNRCCFRRSSCFAVVSRLFRGCFRCFTVGRMPPVAAPPTTVRVVLVVATQLTQLPPRLCGSLARTSSPPPPPTHTTACFTQRQRPRCGHPSSQHYHSAALLGQDLGRHAQVGAVQAGERSAESCGRLVRPGDIGAE